MTQITIDVEDDSLGEVIRADLIEQLKMMEKDDPSNKTLITAMNRVIAWYSVPGTWKGGKYDG